MQNYKIWKSLQILDLSFRSGAHDIIRHYNSPTQRAVLLTIINTAVLIIIRPTHDITEPIRTGLKTGGSFMGKSALKFVIIKNNKTKQAFLFVIYLCLSFESKHGKEHCHDENHTSCDDTGSVAFVSVATVETQFTIRSA